MRILQLASEAVPYAKTGGLADVVGSLASYLGASGHDVRLALPHYRVVREAGHSKDGEVLASFSPPEVGTSEGGTLVSGPGRAGLGVWFVDIPHLYDRDGLYGSGGSDHPDNLRRFTAFVRAALIASDRLGFRPDVVHCHDWQSSLAPAWLAGHTPTVLTVHNLAYQGWFAAADRAAATAPANPGLALPGSGDLSLLAIGLRAADQVTTVSPRYAAEIATPRFGCGFDPLIRALDPPVTGILNGIDTDVWDPAADPYLPATFDSSDLSGKAECRTALLAEFALDDAPDGPVFGLVSRLVDQKGIGLFGAIRDRIASMTDSRFVFLGSGDFRHEELLRQMGELPHVATRIAFSERLAHLVEAGSDFFLMPSSFEPCGLNQMISHRYGTLPIVHRVGGLADSVSHASASAIADGTASGIVFDVHDAQGLAWGIQSACELFADPPAFHSVQQRVMRLDHSWASRIGDYELLYDRVVARHRNLYGKHPT